MCVGVARHFSAAYRALCCEWDCNERCPQDRSREGTKLELYRTAVQTRNMEIELFWKRSNYFLVLNTAIAVGFFAKLQNGYYAFVLALLGAIVSGLWLLVNLGSKFWQSRWEYRSSVTERAFANDADLFSASKEAIKRDVMEHLKFSDHGRFRLFFDRLLMKKPSVSFLMTVLSGIFVLFWIVVWVMSVVGLGAQKA